jgi:hypothetical protein
MTFAPDPDAPAPLGCIELISPLVVVGWTWHPAFPDAHAEVRVYLHGGCIAAAPADAFREDLSAAGVGSGEYGFMVRPSHPMDRAVAEALTVTALFPDGSEHELPRHPHIHMKFPADG